jgi:hypothetical protein
MRGRSSILLLGLLLVGCTRPTPAPTLGSPDPAVSIPAMKKAVRDKDLAAARYLIQDLDSSDPAVRMYAINALEKLTGHRFDYEYYVAEEQRRPAVDKWKQWLAEQPEPNDKPPRPQAHGATDNKTGG